MESSARPLLLIGPSVRWLMQSAARAGLHARGIDFFADVDALRAGPVNRVGCWSKIPEVAAGLQPGAILVAGGFETQPATVEQLRRLSPLWNLSAESCSACRDPVVWAAACEGQGLRVPRHLVPGRPPDGDAKPARWLVKRPHSAGGSGVQWLRETELSSRLAAANELPGEQYLQEWIGGEPVSALFFVEAGAVSCLGFFQQLVGRREFGAVGFQYCGGIGPLPPTPAQRAQLASLGRALLELGGRGVMGVDCIAAGDHLWPVEINPRITATGELWERATPGASLVALQARAFAAASQPDANRAAEVTSPECIESLSAPQPGRVEAGRVFGKAVLYWSDHAQLVVEESRSAMLLEAAAEGRLADIPQPGSKIETGDPLVTLFAHGATARDVLALLEAEALRVNSALQI